MTTETTMTPQREWAILLRPVFERQGLGAVDAALLAGIAGLVIEKRLRASGEKPCSICGDAEPSHVHNGNERIEDYFTVGRGETDFDAARRWKARALTPTPDAVGKDGRVE